MAHFLKLKSHRLPFDAFPFSEELKGAAQVN